MKRNIACILAVSLFSISQYAAADSLDRFCKAAGAHVVRNFKIDNYGDSWTSGAMYSYIENNAGSVYQLPYVGLNDVQTDRQAEMAQETARIAFLTGKEVSMCVNSGVSPSRVWIIQMSSN